MNDDGWVPADEHERHGAVLNHNDDEYEDVTDDEATAAAAPRRRHSVDDRRNVATEVPRGRDTVAVEQD